MQSLPSGSKRAAPVCTSELRAAGSDRPNRAERLEEGSTGLYLWAFGPTARRARATPLA